MLEVTLLEFGEFLVLARLDVHEMVIGARQGPEDVT